MEDQKSSNGTFINGTRITSQVLKEGDNVLLGLVSFRFVGDELKLESAISGELAEGLADKGPSRLQRNFNSFLLAAFLIVAVIVVALFLVQPEDASQDSPKAGSASTEDGYLFSQPSNLSTIIGQVRESIVGIECKGASGSGWILNSLAGAVIVTNHHVVADCLDSVLLNIVLDGSIFRSTVVNGDESSDLAILKSPDGLKGLETGSAPPVGAWLMVIGNPIGLDRSINYGTLTNKAEGLLITDAAINPGNSGGPVFNSRGDVIGVASAKLVADGIDRIGLVIPLEDLCLELLECSAGQWQSP